MLYYVLISLATLLSAVLFVPAAIFSIECIAGCFGSPRSVKDPHAPRPAAAILIPAHNEELNIAGTIANIRNQMRDGDRIVVVADNCSDLTATLAREAGAEVVERTDEARRGKGYALDAGVRFLDAATPQVVVIVDADCWLEPDALDNLVRMAATTGKPVQSRYLLTAPDRSELGLAVSEFAILLKNRIRLRGLSRLGLPVHLTGSGMAFPWLLLRDANLASGNLVEDMALGLDLARAGHAPCFCDAAFVKSQLPYSKTGADTQSARWEAGRFALLKPLLRALFRIETYKTPAFLVLTLDALVPPITLLLLLVVLAFIPATLLAASGAGMAPLAISLVTTVLLGSSLLIAWWLHGREILPVKSLSAIPVYVGRKLRHYPRHILGSGDRPWVRTDRNRPATTGRH